MRKIIIFFSLLYSAISFAQPNYGYYYSSTLGGIETTRGILELLQDNTLIGVDRGTGNNSFKIFKTDLYGNMLWSRRISLGTQLAASGYIYMAVLKDTTVAVLLKADQQYGFYLFKLDRNGAIIWSNWYNDPIYTTADIAADENGGLYVATAFGLLYYINQDGTIKKIIYFYLNCWQVMSKPNGVVTIMGSLIMPPRICLLDFDSNEVITNNYIYTFSGDTATLSTYGPFENLVLDASGGLYMMAGMHHGQIFSYGVIRFNSLNQVLWARRVDSYNVRSIIATPDGGCLSGDVRQINPPQPQTQTMFTKFDAAGNTEWSKSPLELNNTTFNNGFHSLTSDTGNGFYCFPTLPNLHINHVDSIFNGFCNYQTPQPNITTFQVTDSVLPDTFAYFVGVFDSAITTTSTLLSWYRYDACTGVLIDSTTGTGELQEMKLHTFPNPVTNLLTVSFPREVNKGLVIIYNLTEEKILETSITNQDELTLDVEHLNSGIYFVKVQVEKWTWVEKILKN